MVFLANHAKEHAILLPGRIPGHKRDDMQLLPSSTTRKVSTIKDILVAGGIFTKYGT